MLMNALELKVIAKKSLQQTSQWQTNVHCSANQEPFNKCSQQLATQESKDSEKHVLSPTESQPVKRQAVSCRQVPCQALEMNLMCFQKLFR